MSFDFMYGINEEVYMSVEVCHIHLDVLQLYLSKKDIYPM